MATFEMESGYHVLYWMHRLLLQTVRIFAVLCSCRMWQLHSRILIIESRGKEVEDGHCWRDKQQTAARLIVVHTHTGLCTFRYKYNIPLHDVTSVSRDCPPFF